MLHFVLKKTIKANIPFSFFKKITNEVLNVLKVKKDKNIELSLLLVGRDKIKTLNKQYRGQDQITDVLAFSQLETTKYFKLPKTSSTTLGDIIICYPQAKKQAKRCGHSILTELTILFVHGLIHLLGIDHQLGRKHAQLMMKLERKILKRLNL